jgi:hypothetical protein
MCGDVWLSPFSMSHMRLAHAGPLNTTKEHLAKHFEKELPKEEKGSRGYITFSQMLKKL